MSAGDISVELRMSSCPLSWLCIFPRHFRVSRYWVMPAVTHSFYLPTGFCVMLVPSPAHSLWPLWGTGNYHWSVEWFSKTGDADSHRKSTGLYVVMLHWCHSEISSSPERQQFLKSGHWQICCHMAKPLAGVVFSSVDWAIHISWSRCCLCVCLGVCLDVNQDDTNRSRCTQRLVTLRAQTH